MLGSDERFEQMCFYLARKEFPNAIPTAAGSWDGGRDIICFASNEGDVVWQCKFTKRGLSELKPKILASIEALNPGRPIKKWILCTSAEQSGKFYDWLRDTVATFPFIRSFEVWDRPQLLDRLDRYPDVLEMFFYPAWKALESRFRTEELELIRYELVSDCGWEQPSAPVLFFRQTRGSNSDLVMDIVVRNRGTLQSLIQALRIEIYDVKRHLRGLPGEGLLYPQCTYRVSLGGGRSGTRVERLEPPVIVDAGKHERFRVKLVESGYAWTGYVRLSLAYGDDRSLNLPAVFLRL